MPTLKSTIQHRLQERIERLPLISQAGVDVFVLLLIVVAVMATVRAVPLVVGLVDNQYAAFLFLVGIPFVMLKTFINRR